MFMSEEKRIGRTTSWNITLSIWEEAEARMFRNYSRRWW